MSDFLESLKDKKVINEKDLIKIVDYQSKTNLPTTHLLQRLYKGLSKDVLEKIIKSYDKTLTVSRHDISTLKPNLAFIQDVDMLKRETVITKIDNKDLVLFTDVELKPILSKWSKSLENPIYQIITLDDYKYWCEYYSKYIEKELERLNKADSMLSMNLVEDILTERDELLEKQDIEEDDIESDEFQLDELASPRKILNVVSNAINIGASDIHFEPFEKEGRIRFRVDGHMKLIESIKIKKMNTLINSCVAQYNLKSKVPSGSNTTIVIGQDKYDLRISGCPTIYGLKVEMRILSSSRNIDINRVGMSDKQLSDISELLKYSSGMILVTGPTGAGKSETLISMIASIDNSDIVIDTIEDPVEHKVMGVVQRQISEQNDLTFSVLLKEILRQDPDIIMVGETRDRETAQTIVMASNTGHLVLTSLHTNAAYSALTRLVDMGVEPWLVNQNILGVINQRLLRKLCTCKEEYIVTEEDVKMHNLSGEWLGKLTYKPVGCSHCNDTGYSGRTGIFETLIMTDEVRKKTRELKGLEEFEYEAKELIRTLRQRASDYLLLGITSLEEVTSNLYDNTKLQYNSNDIESYSWFNDTENRM